MTIPMEAQNVDVAAPPEENTQVLGIEENNANQEQSDTQRPSAEAQERNWRAMENSKLEAERRNRDYEKQLSEYSSIIKDFVSSGKKEAEPEEEIEESEIPTFGQTKKAIKREAEKIAKQMINQTMAEREKVEAPSKLKGQYSDFDQVVSKENVDYLINNEPELAAILKEVNDPYKQGKAAYKFIKSLGISKKDSVEAMKQDASANAGKPVSPNAMGTRSSVGDANAFSKGLTPDLKKQLHKEMIEAIKKN